MKFYQPSEVTPLTNPNSGGKKYQYFADFVASEETRDGLANHFAEHGWRLHSVWYEDGVTWMMFERQV